MHALRRAYLIVCLAAAPAFGQAQASSGDIKGTVTDPSGSSVKGVHITAVNSERGITRSTESWETGDFILPLLPPGRYRIRVEATGFAPRTYEDVQVRIGDTVVLPVALSLSQLETELNVKAEPPVVETERTQQAATIQTEQILNLPINRRSYLDLALLTPAVVETNDMVDGTDYRVVQAPQSGLSFGGSNGRGNAFFLDGSEHYQNSGGVRPSLSQEAVAEFQVNRNGFSAEFGGGFGGAVNIVSKSGTNNVHGDVFGFLRHRSIQARNYFDPGKSAFTRSQAGATLGAPIRKDKTFVFLAFERLDRHETSFVPILQDRSAFEQLTRSQQQLVDFFNASGNPSLRRLAAAADQALIPNNNARLVKLFNDNSGVFPFSESNNQGSFRIDHHFSKKNNLFLRGNISDGASTNAQLGALLAFNRGRGIAQRDGTIMLSDIWLLTDRTVNDMRAMFGHYTLDVTTIDPYGPQLDITGFGLFGREIFLPAKTIEKHFQFSDTLNLIRGKHTIKFGGDVNPVKDNVRTETFFSGRFSFGENVPLASVLISASGDPNLPTSLATVLSQTGQQRLIPNLSEPISALQAYSLGLPTYYQQGFGDPNWAGTSKRFNLFAQDTYRVSRKLTLNYGVRYELEVNPPSVGTDPDNVAPRVGFAWTPFANEKTVIRAGYGMFYSQNNLQIANVAEALSGKYIQQVFVPLSGAPGLNNPLTGRTLTSADIYQRLLAQGVIGSRTIARSDLAQFGITPNPALPFAVIFGIVPNWKNPYSEQASFEVEQAIGGFSVSVAYNFNRGLHLPRILDRNLYYGPRRPDGQPTFGFYNPLVFQRNIFEPTANTFYHAGIVQVNKRFSNGFALTTHYTLSKAIDEVTDFNTDFQPQDQLNARAERARSSFDQKHRFVAAAVMQAPVRDGGFMGHLASGWTFSPIFVASSGRPFNVLTGVDNLGDRHPNDHRPLRAGRNIGQGPAYYSLDARLSRRFPLGKETRNLEFIAEGFNLANHTNFRTVNNTVGNITVEQLPKPLVGVRGVPTNPLSFTSAYDPRQFQFGLKFNY